MCCVNVSMCNLNHSIIETRDSSVALVSRECKECGQLWMSNNNKQKEPEKKEPSSQKTNHPNIKQWKHWIINRILRCCCQLMYFYCLCKCKHTHCKMHDDFLFNNREFFRGRRLDAGVFFVAVVVIAFQQNHIFHLLRSVLSWNWYFTILNRKEPGSGFQNKKKLCQSWIILKCVFADMTNNQNLFVWKIIF